MVFLDDREKGHQVLEVRPDGLRVLVPTRAMRVAHRLILILVGLAPLPAILFIASAFTGQLLYLGIPLILGGAIPWILGIVAANVHVWRFVVRRPGRAYGATLVQLSTFGPRGLQALVSLSDDAAPGQHRTPIGQSPLLILAGYVPVLRAFRVAEPRIEK